MLKQPKLFLLRFICAIALLIIIVNLWLPFGFNSGDIQEHWHIRTFFEFGTSEYDNTPPDYFLQLAQTRPVARLVFGIAYLLAPDSFIGDNILAILILWLKSVLLMTILLEFFPKAHLLAFLTSTLFILYPSDSGLVSLRVIHIHFSFAAYLLALLFFIRYWRRRKAGYLIVMLCSLLMACLAYEAAYPLIFMTPLVLVFLEKRLSFGQLRLSFIWWLLPTLCFLYSVSLIFALGFGFQDDIVTGNNSAPNFISMFLNLYERNLFLAWRNNLLLPVRQFNLIFFAYAFANSLIILLSGLIIHRLNSNAKLQISWHQTIYAVGLGFLILFLGFLMYVPTSRANVDDYRIFIFSLLGASLIFGFLAYKLLDFVFHHLSDYVFIFAISIAVFSASYLHITFHAEYTELHQSHKEFLTNLFNEMPLLDETVNIVIIPEDGTLNTDLGVLNRPHLLTSALDYILESADAVHIAIVCRDLEQQCLFTENGLDVDLDNLVTTETMPPRLFYPYETMLIFEISDNGQIEFLAELSNIPNYQPELVPAMANPLPERLFTLFD